MADSSPMEDILREQWRALSADIKKVWPHISDAELTKANGDFTAIEGLVRQKYGATRADTHAKLEELTADFRRDLKQQLENNETPTPDERDGVRGSLRDQYRQF